ncbi:toxin-antitoxin system YwqK family antitoxin [Kangiella sp. TOML190]|uniref:toxin-antitoxin system YwqK family antitoxin n=1 Tax=Kangiella sp. TOML190 TaxID=2931351 RepID=UPI002040BFB0|nr:hypothetical protein [Kangiella sp. TOML190]
MNPFFNRWRYLIVVITLSVSSLVCAPLAAASSEGETSYRELAAAQLAMEKKNGRLFFSEKVADGDNKALSGAVKIIQDNGYIEATYRQGFINGVFKQVKKGKTAFLIEYCDGRPCGDYKQYYADGKLAKHKQYNKWNQLEGDFKVYSKDDGRIVRKTRYRQGKKNGFEVLYFEQGLEGVKSRSEFLNDQKHGQETYYYQEGGVELRQLYQNGELDGRHIKFAADGKKSFEANYKDNQLHGSVWMYLEGEVWILKHYQNGKLHGKWIEYDLEKKGVTKQIKYFENDQEIAQQGWSKTNG